jgi:hypothetical protein
VAGDGKFHKELQNKYRRAMTTDLNAAVARVVSMLHGISRWQQKLHANVKLGTF